MLDKRRQPALDVARAKQAIAAEIAARSSRNANTSSAIRAELPRRWHLLVEDTQVRLCRAYLASRCTRRATYIHSGYQGTLGFSYATALGAKVARPDRPVVSISGDGGFMYNVQEMSTAALHGIDW